jgi:hypothetical protein
VPDVGGGDVPSNATLAKPVNAFLAPAGNEGSTDVKLTRNGRQLTLAARQDDAPFRPSATLPAGAQPLTSTDVEGSTVSITDDAAYWSYDGWNYRLELHAHCRRRHRSRRRRPRPVRHRPDAMIV